MNIQRIKNISLAEDFITLNFQEPWYQEDINYFSDFIISALPLSTVQEKIRGADRENIRFSWQKHYYILNFDCCSQSCWIEGQDEESAAHLNALYVVLNKP